MEPRADFSRVRGPPSAARPEEPDGALVLFRRLPLEAQRAAAALAVESDARGERVLRQVTRLLLAAELDAARDAAAAAFDRSAVPEAATDTEIEEAAVRLTATHP